MVKKNSTNSQKKSKWKSLEIKPISHKLAAYACIHWHYAKRVPSGKLIRYGVFEDGKYIGAVIYGSGANHNAHKPFGVRSNEICELVRVALKEHDNPVTKIIARTLKLLKMHNPELKVVISYADIDVGHKGIIYRAGNWTYLGVFKQGEAKGVIINGKEYHVRTANSIFISLKGLKKEWVKSKGKHKFAYVLDDEYELPPTAFKPAQWEEYKKRRGKT